MHTDLHKAKTAFDMDTYTCTAPYLALVKLDVRHQARFRVNHPVQQHRAGAGTGHAATRNTTANPHDQEEPDIGGQQFNVVHALDGLDGLDGDAPRRSSGCCGAHDLA